MLVDPESIRGHDRARSSSSAERKRRVYSLAFPYPLVGKFQARYDQR
jgi:hypothetical protein